MKAKEIRLVHRGEYLVYYEIDYSDEYGNIKTYEIVSKAGCKKLKTPELTLDTIGNNVCAVVMLVFNRDHSKMLLSKEFRMGVNQYVINSPAGMIDAGETMEEAARRELKEETGLDLVKVIDSLNVTFTCAPVTDDATGMLIVEADGEITGSDSIFEEIHSKWYSKQEVIELLNNDDIKFAGRTQAYAYAWAVGI